MRMTNKRPVFLGVLLSYLLVSGYASAQTAMETDRIVGACVNYAILAQKTQAAEDALRMASSRDRAMRFAEQKMDEVKRMNEKGNWNADTQRAWAQVGAQNCREIGVRVADY